MPRLPSEDEAVVPPQIDILNPEADAALDIQRPVVMNGDVAGLSEGNVMVRVRHSLGVVLDERRGQRDAAHGRQRYVAVGSGPGPLRRHSRQSRHGPGLRGIRERRNYRRGGHAEVIFGVDLEQPWIAIDTPIPYAQVATDGVVSVTGRGGGLFENNVVIEAQDDVGNVLFVAPTTARTEEVGGSGPWELSFAVDYVVRGLDPSPLAQPRGRQPHGRDAARRLLRQSAVAGRVCGGDLPVAEHRERVTVLLREPRRWR